jgi:hypothetical protein
LLWLAAVGHDGAHAKANGTLPHGRPGKGRQRPIYLTPGARTAAATPPLVHRRVGWRRRACAGGTRVALCGIDLGGRAVRQRVPCFLRGMPQWYPRPPTHPHGMAWHGMACRRRRASHGDTGRPRADRSNVERWTCVTDGRRRRHPRQHHARARRAGDAARAAVREGGAGLLLRNAQQRILR